MAGRARYRDEEEDESYQHRPSGSTVIGMADAHTPIVEGPSGLQGGRGLTDPLVWQNKFRRQDSQLTALPAKPAAAQQAGGITQTVLNAILPAVAPNPFVAQPLQFSLNGVQPKPATHPLSVLASGGENHMQMWERQAAEGRKRVSPFVDRTQPMRTTYGPKPFLPQEEDLSGKRSPFSWGSAFR